MYVVACRSIITGSNDNSIVGGIAIPGCIIYTSFSFFLLKEDLFILHERVEKKGVRKRENLFPGLLYSSKLTQRNAVH